jgi:acyl carrier protein
MTVSQTDTILSEVFAGVFGKPVDISQPLTRESFPAWDSLKHMEIIFALESATGLEFSEDQIAAIKSVDDLRTAMGQAHAA